MAKKASTFLLEESINPELKKIAKKQDRSVSWLINDILKKYIQKNKA